jgi:hypothetical protein
MRNPRPRAGMIGCLIAIVLVVASWPVPSIARCNDVSESGVAGKIFGQFSTYFQSSGHRETETKTRDFPSAWKDRRFDDSDIFIKACDLRDDGDAKGAGAAALILEKPKHEPGVFLHDSIFRLWHKRLDVIERWLGDGKEILSKSAIRDCVFDSAAIASTKHELRERFGNGLRHWETLCWNGLFSGYAALIRQDLIDGSHDGEIERRFGDHQLLVWIDIKALVD